MWLKALGAHIGGYSLPPDTRPSLYLESGIHREIASEYGDVRDRPRLEAFFREFNPELILHLAAQPLVRHSYGQPVATFAINAIGTAHVLEAACLTPSAKAAVCVTTDKVYKNNEWPWPYRENDPLGGKDPYSASKAAAEMIIDSYCACFGKTDGTGLAIAAARGGNIIGGGDWSEDRLVPDFVRAVVSGSRLVLRYPDAIRPWQHVLALVQGYLMLLAGLIERPQQYARAWNFGPMDRRGFTVREVLDALSHHWARPDLEYMDHPLPETHCLTLDSSLARNLLGWLPAWDTRTAIAETAAWYRQYYSNSCYSNPSAVRDLSMTQLDTWRTAVAEAKR
jgi:CDP-glucose 4,6-dehydratase